MNKQELSEIIELDFQRFESGELAPIDRIPVVDNIIKNCLEYIERYKSPYKHPFMNDKVKITKNFLDELELMKQQLIGNVIFIEK